MLNVFIDALLDTAKLFPFLLLIYIIIEVIEHKTSVFGNRKILQGSFAPLIGSAAGLVPLCGFSVMAAKLYEKKYIRTGALLAVFIATSDEAVILLLSDVTNVSALSAVLPLLIIKFLLALIVGYAANAILVREKVAEVGQFDSSTEYSCEHESGDDSPWKLFFLYPLLHALKIALYLFVVNFLFGTLIYYVGENRISGSLAVNSYLQPLITAAVGLIPGCASSVILTSAFTSGVITFGSLTAGLVVNAGMGFVILLKNPKLIKTNLAIIFVLYAVSYLCGILVNAITPLFPFPFA